VAAFVVATTACGSDANPRADRAPAATSAPVTVRDAREPAAAARREDRAPDAHLADAGPANDDAREPPALHPAGWREDPAAARAAAPPAPTPGPEGPPPAFEILTPYFNTPALRAALDDYHAGRNRAAARAFGAYVAAHGGDAPPDARVRPARLLALLSRHDAGEDVSDALDALGRAWPLFADYAAYYAGSARFRAAAEREASGTAAVAAPAKAAFLAAAETLARVPRRSTLWSRAVELRARALDRAGEKSRAERLLTDLLARRPRARVESYRLLIRLREQLGDRAGARAARLELAVHFPTSPAGRTARAALRPPRGLSPKENLRLGRALLRRFRYKDALACLSAAAAALPRFSAPRCEALAAKARALEKSKKRGAAWRVYDRVLGCRGEPLADATFRGGRNRLKAGKPALAERLLRRHIRAFPARSTADDAAVLRAQALRALDRPAEARAALREALERWPDGDRADAIAWELVWPEVEAHRWRAALRAADEVLGVMHRERSYRAEGRVRYWRGVAAFKLRRRKEARRDWEAVLAEHPLSWYALLAYARLHAMGPAVARRGVSKARAARPVPPDPLGAIPQGLWADAHVRRAVELARMGLGKSAARELKAVRVKHEPGEERRWAWARVALYDLAGDTAKSAGLARTREADLTAAWPEPPAPDAAAPHRRLWELAHPRPYAALVHRWADARHIDPHWIWSIMREESGFHAGAVSWAHAMGLMQIVYSTAKHLAQREHIRITRDSLRRPDVSIRLASRFLAGLLRRHPAIPLASAGYNAGSGAVSKWRRRWGHLELDELVEHIPYDEARGYAKRVTRSLGRYHYLYDGGDPDTLLLLPLAPPGPP